MLYWMHMVQIYLARHGEDADEAAQMLSGRHDTPLTAAGLEAANATARTIWSHGLHFDGVYCSPLQRAYKAAEIITDTLELPKPVARNGLTERDLGVMTGARMQDIEELCGPDIIKSRTTAYFLHADGAETFPELLARARADLEIIRHDHPDGKVLVLTHTDICKLLFAAYYGLEWQPVLSMFHFGTDQLIELSEKASAATAVISKA